MGQASWKDLQEGSISATKIKLTETAFVQQQKRRKKERKEKKTDKG